MINKWQKWQQCHHLFVFLSDCYSCSRVKSSDARNWISIHTNLWDRKSGGSFHFLFHFLCACHWWILGAERRSSFSIFFFCKYFISNRCDDYSTPATPYQRVDMCVFRLAEKQPHQGAVEFTWGANFKSGSFPPSPHSLDMTTEFKYTTPHFK